HADPHLCLVERRGVERAVLPDQLPRQVLAPEIVGEGLAARAQLCQLAAANLDLFVAVVFHLLARCHTPALRLASMNLRRSPSSTAWVLPVSMPVRRSLMRDWSRT